MNKKTKMFMGVMVAFALIGVANFGFVYASNGYDFSLAVENFLTPKEGVTTSSITGIIIGSLIGVIIAGALLPTIANQTATLEQDTAGDLSTEEESLIGTWILLIIVGVMLAIIGMAL